MKVKKYRIQFVSFLNQKGFTHVELVLAIIFICIIVFVGDHVLTHSFAATPTASSSVSITGPSNNATVRGIIPIAVQTSGSVASVHIVWDKTNVIRDASTENANGWGSLWNSAKAPNGQHTITVTIYNTAGHAERSSVTIIVQNGIVSWIMSGNAISLLQGAGASKNLINITFNNSNTYLFGGSPSSVGIPAADSIANYASYQAIETAFDNKTLPGKYQGLIYDNEDWPHTPKAEQLDPTHYEKLVADLAHQHGMLYIATPAVDLVQASGRLVNNNRYNTYISRNIAGNAAKYANVIDIQAQGIDANLSEFTDFVIAAAKQARQANPSVQVLVGIATSGQQAVTNQQLYDAYSAVASVADGYWLNIPEQSSFCPQCGAPQPKIGLYLLQKIYGTN